ncbi:MAG TPA: peptidoglycan-binding protein [Limnochordia bacterium]
MPDGTHPRATPARFVGAFLITAILAAGLVLGSDTGASQAGTAREWRLGERVLRRGQWGGDVFHLQRLLRAAGYEVEATGTFGPQTEQAVKAFQAAQGLTVDGLAGPATIAALQRVVEGGGAPTEVYVVRPGDTLWDISQRFGTTMDHLIELNHLASATLYPGQELRVPAT